MAEYRWNVSSHADGYDQAGPQIHPYYVDIQEILLGLLQIDTDANACVLDLGGGSGRLVEKILEQSPQVSAVILDQSEAFLGLAERRLNRFGERVTLIQARLQDQWSEGLRGQPTAMVSMSAIHHLDSREKADLYQQSFDCLAGGGIFINGDEVRTDDEQQHQVNLRSWAEHMESLITRRLVPEQMSSVMRGWIERNVTNFGQPKVSGDDCHETVAAQLAYLHDAGFAEIEVPWQRDLWAVLVGRKSS
jgi:cyclopropane fatty-acyl-phospholipid synthase-like methyltransferase